MEATTLRLSNWLGGFPGGPVVKTAPSNTGLSKTQTTVLRPETAGVARQDLLIPGNERRGLGLKQDTDWVSQWNEGLWFLLGSELLSSEPHLRWTVLDLN